MGLGRTTRFSTPSSPPRPIGWDFDAAASDGFRQNLAPYFRFSTQVSYFPPQSCLRQPSAKPDRATQGFGSANIRETGVFAVKTSSAMRCANAMNNVRPVAQGCGRVCCSAVGKAAMPDMRCCGFVTASPRRSGMQDDQIVTLEGANNFMRDRRSRRHPHGLTIARSGHV